MKNNLLLLVAILLSAVNARAGDAITGTVAETMNSGGYTYARVVKDGATTWVAVPPMKLKKGDAVTFQAGMVMDNFNSPTLKRTFDRIVFSEGPAKAAAKSPAAAMASPHSGAPTVKKDSSPDVKTAKAAGPNARTVAEVYAQRAELAGKPVAVRGKVVKVNNEIMNLNWVHLQDGSGDAAAGTFDLVVTTNELAKVGETITASGSVAKDKNFGMGYKYVVLLEKATLTR